MDEVPWVGSGFDDTGQSLFWLFATIDLQKTVGERGDPRTDDLEVNIAVAHEGAELGGAPVDADRLRVSSAGPARDNFGKSLDGLRGEGERHANSFRPYWWRILATERYGRCYIGGCDGEGLHLPYGPPGSSNHPTCCCCWHEFAPPLGITGPCASSHPSRQWFVAC